MGKRIFVLGLVAEWVELVVWLEVAEPRQKLISEPLGTDLYLTFSSVTKLACSTIARKDSGCNDV